MFDSLKHVSEDREEGFTLVELLVVIVIIGILVAVAVGYFLDQKTKATNASLKSDLKTVSTQVATELMDKTPAEMNEMFGGRTGAYATNSDGDILLSSKKWNDIDGLADINVSKGNTVEITVINNPSGAWSSKFEEGEFCLAATNPNSDYNYVPGSGKAQEYDKYLYYDPRAGGVKTMDELKDIANSGVSISCEGYVTRWVGSTTPEA